MKTTQIIILFLFPFLLHSQWQETEFGFISKDSTFGNIKFDKNFDAITFESNKSMSVFDLIKGEIINQKTIDNPNDSLTVTTYNLEYQFQMFTVLNNPKTKDGKILQPFKIYKYQNNQTIDIIFDTLRYDYDQYNFKGAVGLDFKLIEDSLLFVTMEMLQYGQEEVESDMTFIYNLESKVYNQLSGRFYYYKDFSPNTGIIFIKNGVSIQEFTPDVYTTSTSYHFYKLGESKSKYYNSDKLNLRNVVLPNMSNNLILFSDNGYFLESFDSEDRLEQKTTKYLDMNAKFSEFDDFLILHDNTNNQNVFHIVNYENNKILETIQLDYNLKLNFIKHKDEYLYCRSEDGKILKIYVPFFDANNLVSNFQTDKDIYFTGEEIEFYDKSSGYPNKWLWDFGNGKHSTSQNPKHIYTKTGLYTISLIAENENGLKDTIVKNNNIQIISKLVADFDYTILEEDPFIVQFNNKSKGDIVKYIWNFGDGNLSNTENPTHNFGNGIFDISLTVYDELDNINQKLLLKEFDRSIQSGSSIVTFTPSGFMEKQLPTENRLLEVEFFNDKIGVIVSDTGEIYYTSDGGISWDESDYNKNFTPTRLRFLSNGDVIISGKKGILLKSFDYGVSWKAATFLQTDIDIIDFDCSSPLECFLIEGFNAIKFNYKLDFLELLDYRQSYNRENITNKLQSMNYSGGRYNWCSASNRDNEYTEYFRHGQFETTNFKSSGNVYYEDTEKTARNFTFINSITENHILTIEHNRIVRLYTRLKSSGPSIRVVFSSNEHQFTKLFASKDMVIIPTNKGEIIYFDSISIEEQYREMNFRIDSFKVTDSPLFDYHQISPNRGITIGESGKYYITDFITNVKTNKPFNQLNIYPNPVNDEFTIQFKKQELITKLEIYTLTGNKISSNDYNQYTNFINFKAENLNKGTYFLKIITNNDTFYRKIVKF